MALDYDKISLNDFGKYFLTLPDKIKELEANIVKSELEINGINSMRSTLDLRKLTTGNLTGDVKLDAAIALSFSSSDLWLPEVLPTLQKILSQEKVLSRRNWGGGHFLYDATTQDYGPYCGELFFGRLENPRLSVLFDNAKEFQTNIRVPDSVKIFAETYEHFENFAHAFDGTRTLYTPGKIDITSLFETNIGESKFRGLYLGNSSISKHLYKIKSHFGDSGVLSRRTSETDFIDKVLNFLSSGDYFRRD